MEDTEMGKKKIVGVLIELGIANDKAQAWLDKRAEKKARKRDEKEPAQPEEDQEPPQSITVDGEVYSVGDRFRWCTDGFSWEYGEIGTITGFKDGYAVMASKPMLWSPWSDHWKRVTEPAQPAWDGEFVPGEFYQGVDTGRIVLCQDGKPQDDECFYGVTLTDTLVGNAWYNDKWKKSYFRPVKVKITVEE